METEEDTGKVKEAPKVKGVTPEEVARRERLVAFLQSFVKAMLQTGYYSPDHPQAVKAKEGLYESFRDLLGSSHEVSFMARFEKGEGKDIYIDGVTEEPTSLNAVMTSAQSDLFLPKFTEYFYRRGLVSFSLKEEITKEEFENFIEVMSEARRSEFGAALAKGKELTRELVDNQIVHVSTVFDDDVVKIGRAVPWRVEMALLRLRKDLSVIPMFRHLSGGQMAEVKREVIEDIIRPIAHPAFFVDLLLNASYVLGDVEGLEDVDIETEIIRCMRPALIGEVAERLAGKIPTGGELEGEDEESANIIRVLLRKVGERILEIGAQDAIHTLYKLHNLGVLSFDELPDELRKRIQIEKMTEEFLQEPEKYLDILRNSADAAAYRHSAGIIEEIFPELVHRGELEKLAEAVSILSSQWGEENPPFPDRPDMSDETIERLSSEPNRKLLREALDKSPRAERKQILSIFRAFGPVSITELLDVLATSEDASVRKDICQHLVNMGRVALPSLGEALKMPDRPWYLVRNLINIIGDIGAPRSADDVSQFVSHSHPKVREEALVALCKILGDGAEPVLIHALHDADPPVAARAVALLGSIRSRRSRVLKFYEETLKPDSVAADVVQSQICIALGLLGEVELPSGISSVALLAEVLSRGKSRKFLGFKKGMDSAPASVRREAALALGRIGTEEARKVLKEHAGDKDSVVRKAVEDAISRQSPG